MEQSFILVYSFRGFCLRRTVCFFSIQLDYFLYMGALLAGMSVRLLLVRLMGLVSKRALEPLERNLHEVVSHHVGVGEPLPVL